MIKEGNPNVTPDPNVGWDVNWYLERLNMQRQGELSGLQGAVNFCTRWGAREE